MPITNKGFGIITTGTGGGPSTPQNLEEVLTTGNDAGNLAILNALALAIGVATASGKITVGDNTHRFAQLLNLFYQSLDPAQSGELSFGDNAGGFDLTQRNTDIPCIHTLTVSPGGMESKLNDAASKDFTFRHNLTSVTVEYDTIPLLTISKTTGNVAVGTGDVEVETIGAGVIMKSPDGTRWKLAVSDLGVVTASAA